MHIGVGLGASWLTMFAGCLQVFDFLEENVRTTPEALGDMHKETPEERLERHERVLASSLTAMRNLLDVLLPAEASAQRGTGRRVRL